jgi:replication factor C subunit 3/5
MSSFLQTGTRTLELELVMLSSAHHVEMNPSDAGFQDRYVVQEVIKEMAKNRPIDAKGKRAFKGWCYFPFVIWCNCY